MQQMLRILVVFMAIGLPMLDITSASTAAATTTVEATTQTTPTIPPTTPPTTASSATTPVPSPPVPENLERGNFSNNCLAVKGKFQFSVTYDIPGSKTQTAVISLPKDAKVNNSSQCSGLIHFPLIFQGPNRAGEFEFTMIFNSTGNDLVMSGVEFKYNLTRDMFPGTIHPNTEETAVNYTMSLNQFNKDNYWLCNANITVKVSDKVTYTVSELDVSADGSKRNSATRCTLDDINNTIPIAVGAALAGLVLIVLIAYLIGRRKSRHGYESV
eukprot:GHVU01220172.1.p1 GENE.GHVU01220172.1~~GHVU01220172.1.p1  ORF type:complete len:271 (+),score=33.47 GHVU01220172.1:137-949(+)